MKKLISLFVVILVIFILTGSQIQAQSAQYSARVDSVRLLSQTGKVFCEVFKSDTLTFHVLRALPLGGVFALKDDFGWTGSDIVQLDGLEPNTSYRFFVERRTWGQEQVVASNTVVATTLPQHRVGTRRNGFTSLSPDTEILTKVIKPSGIVLKSIVLWIYVPKTAGQFILSLVSDRFYGMTFFSTLVSPDTLRGARGTDFLLEVPIVLGAFALPDSFYLKLETDENNSLFFSQADDGLPAEINYLGWQSIGRLMVAFGYEGEWVTSVDNFDHGVIKYCLAQNYPNPFNPETKISYSVEKAGQVKLAIYNVLGQKVADLVNEFKVANTYKVNFDASNLTSGVYFYRLEVGDYSKTMKMIYSK